MTGRQTRRLVVGACLLLALPAGVGCGNGDAPRDGQAPPTITTKSGVEMVVVPAGSFEMGSRGGSGDERPVHKVWIDSFLMDRYEVTQDEYEKIGAQDDHRVHRPLRNANRGRTVKGR